MVVDHVFRAAELRLVEHDPRAQRKEVVRNLPKVRLHAARGCAALCVAGARYLVVLAEGELGLVFSSPLPVGVSITAACVTAAMMVRRFRYLRMSWHDERQRAE